MQLALQLRQAEKRATAAAAAAGAAAGTGAAILPPVATVRLILPGSDPPVDLTRSGLPVRQQADGSQSADANAATAKEAAAPTGVQKESDKDATPMLEEGVTTAALKPSRQASADGVPAGGDTSTELVPSSSAVAARAPSRTADAIEEGAAEAAQTASVSSAGIVTAAGRADSSGAIASEPEGGSNRPGVIRFEREELEASGNTSSHTAPLVHELGTAAAAAATAAATKSAPATVDATAGGAAAVEAVARHRGPHAGQQGGDVGGGEAGAANSEVTSKPTSPASGEIIDEANATQQRRTALDGATLAAAPTTTDAVCPASSEAAKGAAVDAAAGTVSAPGGVAGAPEVNPQGTKLPFNPTASKQLPPEAPTRVSRRLKHRK